MSAEAWPWRTHAPPQPTLTLETELPDQDEYEVRIYDERHGRRLVAAIELISPSNKDRPESRRAFVGKVAALLQRNVCVSLVDVVTIRDFNLYADLLEFVGGNDPALERKRHQCTRRPFAAANARDGGRCWRVGSTRCTSGNRYRHFRFGWMSI